MRSPHSPSILRSVARGRRVQRSRSLKFFSVAMTAGLSAVAFLPAGLANAATKVTSVNVTITPSGCAPKPASAPAGEIDVNVTNKNASAVSEVELRSSDLSHILGEQENLTPGLSGGFSLDLQPGKYVMSCPGASQPHSTFTVTGKSTGPKWQSIPKLVNAVKSYATYINQNTAKLVSASQALCTAINSGSLTNAKAAYPKARVFYERIEPVAEIWGALDVNIDGRWENPVTVQSQFIGFHRIEQLLWVNNTLTGTSSLCAGLVKHQQQLLALVKTASYNPMEMAAGATDLVNEAATAKVTGEEERYSNTDLVVLQANLDGANEVVSLLQPYLKTNNASLLKTAQQRYLQATKVVSTFKAVPGYDATGYVVYSAVKNDGRRQLSQSINAYAEALSKLPTKVS